MASKRSAKSIVCAGIVLLTGCEASEDLRLSPSSTAKVTVTPSSVIRKVGESQQFVAQVTGGNSAAGGNATSKAVDWLIDNQFSYIGPLPATLDQDGLATCLRPGSIQVSATYIFDERARGFGMLTCVASTPAELVLINVSPASVDVSVDRNATNEHVCTFRIENIAPGSVMTTYTSDHPALVPNVAGATLPAGGTGSLSVFYKGPSNQPFSTSVTVTATTPEGTQVVKVPIKIGFR